MVRPPILSEAERLDALARARESRKRRAEFKSLIRAGELRWFAALDSTDEAIQKMRVKELIESIPSYGEIRALTILDRVGISHSRRVQGLGKRQRNLLLKELQNR
jgi:guanylate kinase